MYVWSMQKRHNTLLHIDGTAASNAPLSGKDKTVAKQDALASSAEEPKNTNASSNNASNVSNSLSSCHINGSLSHILLSTAIIYVCDQAGNLHECRALLDSGSQANFLSQELCKRLKLPRRSADTIISGISMTSSTAERQTTTTIHSRFNKFQAKLSFLIVNKITNNLPATNVDVDSLQIPLNIKLADPTFHMPGRIDLLLGAEIFWRLLCVGQVRICKTQPTFQKTTLGWIISGAVNPASQQQTALRCHFAQQAAVQEQLEKFWHIEELQPKHHLTQEEQTCEEHFCKTHSRQEDRRFIVQLPLKDNYTELGDSYDTAKRRLAALERRLLRQPQLKRQYGSFLQEYNELGHMKLISEEEEQDARSNDTIYYLPHHAVIKEDSDTTRLRVVFDASAKTSSGLSLNDVQLVGPTIQQDLFSIILRFRQHTYAVSADISKMYRQIRVRENQCKLQRILWRFNQEEKIKTYELQTVTYGEACSAFLVIRALHQAARDLQHRFPKASEIIIHDFYVDDLLTGGNDIKLLSCLKEEIITILGTAKFELHKWKSNHPALMSADGHAPTAVQIGEGTKVLGQSWDTKLDTFRYTTGAADRAQRPTKRQALSSIAQVFDPLGLLGPVITRAKIPRRILCDEPRSIELHGFCDASEQAYGACLYFRTTDANQQHHIRLLCSKSRVAPLKTLTLPRLELCGALLLSRLYQQAIDSLNVSLDSVHFWCDSTIALSWISGSSSQWSTFVANRTSKIQKLTVKGKWHHVRSELNPADIVSRGLNPDEIQNCPFWWKGPSFLQEDYSSVLNDSIRLLPPKELPEVKRQTIALSAALEEDLNLINKFSSLSRLKRVTAYCYRFAHNAKRGGKNHQGEIQGPAKASRRT
ncbi:PREDICTED: uncharacterized protein LOC105556289 [Vollenhovia emeryi]|uniref:uncharacterized protein LOC105556289 n=1 Tax=Vollenhovia emeryi TaxID=411798 RepID=UPI0005F51526|nr:PREDICTED: uncharacterized protein LOC105556289 [Vollenhovia emeryi]